MKKLLFVFCIISLSSAVYSQSESSVFTATGRAGVATTFATDYQALGINPANLGWKPKYEGKHVTFTLSEGAYSIYSEALKKRELKESLFQLNSTDFTYEDKLQAAKDFADAGISVNIDITAIAIAVQIPKVGGFAFGWKEKVNWYSKFSNTATEVMFLGYNAPYFDQKLDAALVDVTDSTDFFDLATSGLTSAPQLFSEILDGSQLTATWVREFNLSYGRAIISTDNISLYGGVGLKYLQGIAIIDLRAENGKLEAFSSISPSFGIDYGSAAATNPSAQTSSSGFLPNSVGSGFAADLGISLIIKEKLKLGIAVNDIGSMTWDGNVYSVKDDTLVDFDTDGFGSLNFFTEIGSNFTSNDGILTWSGENKKTISMPLNMRAGASYQLIIDKLEVGVDAVIPFNDVSGNSNNALVGFGVDFSPVKWLSLSTGISTGGNYKGVNLPVGLTISIPSGTWEMGIATRDVLTYFSSDNPVLSLGFGFMRFRI